MSSFGLLAGCQLDVVVGSSKSLLDYAPEYEGYSFIGWSTSTSAEDIITTEEIAVNSDINLYAIYEAVSTGMFAGMTLDELISGGYINMNEDGEISATDKFDSLESSALVLPEEVTGISSYGFQVRRNITSVDFSKSSVTLVGSYAFQDCKNIEEIKWNNSITAIMESSFENALKAEKFVEFDIPVTFNIGDRAFSNSLTYCKKLTIHACYIGQDSFNNIGSNLSTSDTLNIYIDSTVENINPGSSFSTFLTTTSATSTIYCKAASKPSTWSSKWDNRTSSTKHNVVWGAEF